MRILSGERKREGKKWFLRGFVALLFLVLVSSISPALAVPSPVISVQPASIEVSHGDTFTIEIKIDPKGEEIYGAQYDLYYNPNFLNATLQTPGSFLAQDGATTNVLINKINTSLGKLKYAETRISVERGITNLGTLATITFDVIGDSGTSDLKLSDVILSDPDGEPIEAEINHGICTIQYTGPETPAPATTPLPSVHVHPVTIEEAHEMLAEKTEQIILLDVRSEAEYDAEHIPDARLIPLPELENRIGELDKDKIIIVYCKTGGRSRQASEILVQHHFEHVYNMLGGIQAWRLHFPVSTAVATPTPKISPSSSPFLSPTPALSPTPTASPLPTSTPTPTSAPTATATVTGFEAVIAIIGLLAISLLMSLCKFKIKRK